MRGFEFSKIVFNHKKTRIVIANAVWQSRVFLYSVLLDFIYDIDGECDLCLSC